MFRWAVYIAQNIAKYSGGIIYNLEQRRHRETERRGWLVKFPEQPCSRARQHFFYRLKIGKLDSFNIYGDTGMIFDYENQIRELCEELFFFRRIRYNIFLMFGRMWKDISNPTAKRKDTFGKVERIIEILIKLVKLFYYPQNDKTELCNRSLSFWKQIRYYPWLEFVRSEGGNYRSARALSNRRKARNPGNLRSIVKATNTLAALASSKQILDASRVLRTRYRIKSTMKVGLVDEEEIDGTNSGEMERKRERINPKMFHRAVHEQRPTFQANRVKHTRKVCS